MSTAATSGAAPVRDIAATIAAMHQALAVMPDNIDAMVALGGLYLRAGRLDDAAHWCNQALARKPDHGPALNVLSVIGDTYVETGMNVAVRGDLATTIDIYTRAVRDCRHADAPHYLALFRQTASWFAEAAALPREPSSTRISLAVWGETYVQAAATLFRSLLAPGNVPALASCGPVHIEIATDTAGRAWLERSPAVAEMRRHARIDFFLLDADILGYDRARLPGFQYWIMAACHYATVMRARHAGAHVSFMTADTILADGSLAAARRHIDAGKSAVLFAGLEVERAGFIAATGDDGQSVLAIKPRDLVGHALAHLHPDTAALILEPGKTVSAAIPNPVMFPIEGGGLVQHGFHMGPLMMSASILARRFTPDFLTADARLTRLALDGDDPGASIKVVDDSDEIAAVSMSRQLPTSLSSKPFNAEELGVWASRWCFAMADVPYFEWCFRQRRALRGPGAAGAVAPPSPYETAIVDATLSAFRRNGAQRASRR